MRKIIIAIMAMVLAPTLSYAGSKAEVLHWWTSGGEAKALQVLKDDFAAKGGEWSDMPVAGGGGDAAMQTLKARIVAMMLQLLHKLKVQLSKLMTEKAL